MRTRFVPGLPRRRGQVGVSLIEVVVGMAIGVIASLVIMRSFSGSETFRRNVSGAADTVQTASLIGARLGMLFEEAGASLVQGRNIWGCKLLATRGKTALLPAASYPDPFSGFAKNVRVLPVGVLDGGDNSDIALVISGSSASSNRDVPFDSDGKTLNVANPNGVGIANTGLAVDDLLLAVPQDVAAGPGDCQIVQVASDFSGGKAVADASYGLKVMPAESAVTAPASYTNIKLNIGAASYGALVSTADSPSAFHLGREAGPTLSLISVNEGGELVEYDLLQRTGMMPFGENVVLFKVRYGVDNGVGGAANDNVVDEWISPGEAGWTLADLMDGRTATEQKIDQIKAVRIGVVVRSPQLVINDAKLTEIVLFSDLSDARKVTRKLESAEQRYGYQVYDWVIPLRNMKSTPKS
ncbi:PilW family protein [uncultured Zoogloea sp.]|mgnify:CR=1 FL=1|uniref:PilW family protein n=1 Tax=uncultured Zoogloea sp. TaxID=160237 RepID=UPI0026032704|nr:PilW family protein [uncultured Zoogloea sp.]